MRLIQKGIAIAGGLVLSGMLLFPPWLYVYRTEKVVSAGSATGGLVHADEALVVVHDEREQAAGYTLIFRAPEPRSPSPSDILYDPAVTESVSARLDARRLAVQVTGTALLILVLLIAVSFRTATD